MSRNDLRKKVVYREKSKKLVLFFGHFIFFWPCYAACGILVPQLEIKLMPPALAAWSLNLTGSQGSSIIRVLRRIGVWGQLSMARAGMKGVTD